MSKIIEEIDQASRRSKVFRVEADSPEEAMRTVCDALGVRGCGDSVPGGILRRMEATPVPNRLWDVESFIGAAAVPTGTIPPCFCGQPATHCTIEPWMMRDSSKLKTAWCAVHAPPEAKPIADLEVDKPTTIEGQP